MMHFENKYFHGFPNKDALSLEIRRTPFLVHAIMFSVLKMQIKNKHFDWIEST